MMYWNFWFAKKLPVCYPIDAYFLPSLPLKTLDNSGFRMIDGLTAEVSISAIEGLKGPVFSPANGVKISGHPPWLRSRSWQLDSYSPSFPSKNGGKRWFASLIQPSSLLEYCFTLPHPKLQGQFLRIPFTNQLTLHCHLWGKKHPNHGKPRPDLRVLKGFDGGETKTSCPAAGVDFGPPSGWHHWTKARKAAMSGWKKWGRKLLVSRVRILGHPN